MMNSILALWDPLARLLLQALLHSLWQGTLMAGMILLWFRLAPRLSATTRHAIWLLSLLALAVLPLLTALTSQSLSKPESEPTRQAVAVSSRSAAVSDQPAISEAAPVADTTSGQTAPADVTAEIRLTSVTKSRPDSLSGHVVSGDRTIQAAMLIVGWKERAQQLIFSSPVPSWLVAAWLLVAGLMLLRVIRSWVSLQWLRRTLKPLTDQQQQQFLRLAWICGIQRPIQISTSARVSLPLTIGWWRPLIVLPPDLAQHLSDAECESVIAHELAHIRRQDYPINLLQRLIQALLFFHPAVWLTGRQMAIERELACDDWAVRLTGEPRRYAGSLARLAELLVDGRAPLVASGIIFGRHMVTRRIEMLLDHQHNASTFVSTRALSGAATFLCVVLTACVWFNPVAAVPLQQESRATGQQNELRQTPPAAVVKVVPGKTPAPAVVVQVEALPVQPSVSAMAPAVAAAPSAMDAIPVLPESAAAPVIAVVPSGGLLTMAQSPAPAPGVEPALPPPGRIEWELQEPVAVLGETFDGVISTGSRQSAIPENELLPVLTDIARKDADPDVRREALRGIYRLRSDASIDALIGLYDGISDTKVKSEIIGYLLRRKGDNTKAVTKLVAIVKAEKDEDLQRLALRQLSAIKEDDGRADHLIEIFDSLKDARTKQTIIRYLAASRSKKALDKVKQIAQSDPDPAIRQAAIRALAGGSTPLDLFTAPAPRSIGQGRGIGSTSGLATVPGAVDLSSLYTRRADLSARLNQLLTTYTETHPEVKEYRVKLKSLDDEINRLRGR